MKCLKVLLPSLVLLMSGCGTTSDYSQVLEDIQENLDFGNISAVIQITDSLKKNIRNSEILHVADSLKQIAERINLDFPVTEAEEDKQIIKLLGSVSPEEKTVWEKKGWLECRLIDGEKKYFSHAASNLLLLKKFHEHKDEWLREIAEDPEMIFRLKHTTEVIKSSENTTNPVLPVKMEITYTVTVHPDVVPEGEKIRCWLPWPKEGNERQKDVRMINTSNPEFIIAPDTAIHSTIYMEEIQKKGIATVFQFTCEYISSARYFKIPGIKILPYDKTSVNYIRFTSEQFPHICFTDDVKRLADSIAGDDTEPTSVVRRIYSWFKENIPWTSALEYSTIPNVPEYVVANRRGDCGLQTLLFISMLRYKGIPARWQSGWMMPPDHQNLHDWCEVYYEGPGWVPVDISYDLQKPDNPFTREFYSSGIDSYRLIVNEGIAGPLHPAKRYLRSEPYDFQRGEIEWSGGNLYFDKWDYNMKIRYIK
jgi:hypothetical protein